MRKYDTRVERDFEHHTKDGPMWIVWVDFHGRWAPFRTGHAFYAPPTARQLRHAVQGIKRSMRGKL